MQDVFELQRNLNNAFAYDLVPSPAVITAALRAARRVNDFPTAVRIFEGAFFFFFRFSLTEFVLAGAPLCCCACFGCAADRLSRDQG